VSSEIQTHKTQYDRKERHKMAYNYSKLLGRMKEFGYTQSTLSEAMGKDKSTICSKLNNKGEFKASEIDTICRELDIPNEQIGEYFFAK
jgi:transcriptional regulator with XRE-family HTH domain